MLNRVYQQRLIWYVSRLWDMVYCLADVSSVSPSSEQTAKAWFPYSCICRICRFCLIKRVVKIDTTIWKPHAQLPNTTDTTDTTCYPR